LDVFSEEELTMMTNGARNTWKWIAGSAAAAVVAAEVLGGALGLGYAFAFLSLGVIAGLMTMAVAEWIRDRRNRTVTITPEDSEREEAPIRKVA
jgi:hypothetical protein